MDKSRGTWSRSIRLGVNEDMVQAQATDSSPVVARSNTNRNRNFASVDASTAEARSVEGILVPLLLFGAYGSRLLLITLQ